MEYTEKQMQKAINKNNQDWNDLIKKKYILFSDYKKIIKIIDSRRKKGFKVLLKGMQDLNKTIKKLEEQEMFLNNLLDDRELKIQKAKEDLQ